MVSAVILVKSPKKLIAARLRKVNKITESFPVSGQFDAVAVIDVKELSEIKAYCLGDPDNLGDVFSMIYYTS